MIDEASNDENFNESIAKNLLMGNPKKRHVLRRVPSRRGRLPKCHYCGVPIRGSLIVKIEGSTGGILFYCSGKCCDDNWK